MNPMRSSIASAIWFIFGNSNMAKTQMTAASMRMPLAVSFKSPVSFASNEPI